MASSATAIAASVSSVLFISQAQRWLGAAADRPTHLGFAAVISTNQFKNGSHIEIDGAVFKILEFQHVKPGKGGASVRTKLRKIDDRAQQAKPFRPRGTL